MTSTIDNPTTPLNESKSYTVDTSISRESCNRPVWDLVDASIAYTCGYKRGKLMMAILIVLY